MKKIVTVVGGPGAGKSTVSKRVALIMKARHIPADEFYKRNPFFQKAVTNRKRWSLASDLWFLLQRVKLQKNLLKEEKHSLFVVDSGIPMSFVYAHSRLITKDYFNEEWQLYEEMAGALLSEDPQTLLYLQAEPNFLMKRIHQRGRDYEVKNYTLEYLSAIVKSLEKIVDLYRKSGWEVITLCADKEDQQTLDMLSSEAELRTPVLA